MTRITPLYIERWPAPPHLDVMDVTTPLTGPSGLAIRLAPSIKAVTDEIEDLCDLPTALVAELHDAGAFSLLTSRISAASKRR